LKEEYHFDESGVDGKIEITFELTSMDVLIPVAAKFKAWVCGRSLTAIADSNPAGDMDVCLLRVLCVVRQRSLLRADLSSGGFLSSVVCLSVIVKPR
jgi:hypothetical protein